jgi:hypothetical protein
MTPSTSEIIKKLKTFSDTDKVKFYCPENGFYYYVEHTSIEFLTNLTNVLTLYVDPSTKNGICYHDLICNIEYHGPFRIQIKSLKFDKKFTFLTNGYTLI